MLEASRLIGLPAKPVRNPRYARIEWTLRQLLREGKIGPITHVSCVDRQSHRGKDDGLERSEYAQLLGAGADHLDSLRGILARSPVRVLARCTSPPWSKYRHGSTTEAFVEMAGNLHVHYYGSLTSNRSGHSLWIEGDQGVLWTNRSLIWWRKRGWPVFVPIRSRRVPSGHESQADSESPAGLLERFRDATLAGRVPDASDANLWVVSIIESAIRSDRTRTTVAISDLFHGAGAEPDLAPVPGHSAT